uniref:Uncharacterized protein n=1 Tax=Arundo donax TaxID=35708 RepID=A0A0A8YL76_ARUDO
MTKSRRYGYVSMYRIRHFLKNPRRRYVLGFLNNIKNIKQVSNGQIVEFST